MMSKLSTQLFAVLLSVFTIGAFTMTVAKDQHGAEVEESAFHKTHSGLMIYDAKKGEGQEAKKGQKVRVHYTGSLHPSSEVFDSSISRGAPFEFTLGVKQVIAGWDEGVQGMKEGGRRWLIIPPELGYGDHGVPPTIPGKSTLKFEVELLDVVE